jgi:hypothetical protein
MLISKKQTYLSDKMSLKKVKNKKQKMVEKFENRFLFLTFFEAICQ